MIKKSDKSLKKGRGNSSTKEQILYAAIELFAKQGYADTTILEIVKRTGINLSMVSYHFGGKEALYIACIKEAAAHGAERSLRLLTSVNNSIEFKTRLKIFIEEVLRLHYENEYYSILLRREFFNPSKITRQYINVTFPEMFRSISDFFKTAQKTSVISEEINPQQLALILISSLITIGGEKELVKLVSSKGITDPHFRDSIANILVNMFTPFMKANL